jgi:hypothetical protein
LRARYAWWCLIRLGSKNFETLSMALCLIGLMTYMDAPNGGGGSRI